MPTPRMHNGIRACSSLVMRAARHSHLGHTSVSCPKTFPPHCPQIPDSIGVRLADFAAHKQMFLGGLQSLNSECLLLVEVTLCRYCCILAA
jgi:hypothetical protein